jgi:hypothetical protein
MEALGFIGLPEQGCVEHVGLLCWTNAWRDSLQPCRMTRWKISPRTDSHRSRSAGNPRSREIRIARSSATQHITREWANRWRPARVSEILSSVHRRFNSEPTALGQLVHEIDRLEGHAQTFEIAFIPTGTRRSSTASRRSPG